MKTKYAITILIIFVIIVSTGFFISNRHAIENFGHDFNTMNNDYKKVLFASGQNQSSSNELMLKYKLSWSKFYSNFKENPIKPYNSDELWQSSLDEINSKVIQADDLIKKNKLHEAHLKLEKVREVWQNIFTRNKITMLSFYLTEYHDNMEIAIEQANELDYVGLKGSCNKMLESWKNVETLEVDFSLEEQNDYNSKVKSGRDNLDLLCNAVDNGDDDNVKEASSKLKSLFIPLYLKYG